MTVEIKLGDCRSVLQTLPDKSVHCVVTSPPYMGLRDYDVDGQIGLETSPAAYVAELLSVFTEIWRVLRDDGTVWLNLGDSYAGSGRGGYPGGKSGLNGSTAGQDNSRKARGSQKAAGKHEKVRLAGTISRSWSPPPKGLKAKDLIGIPWRVAFALQDAGWYLRQDIIWSKSNPMPESVTDRCTKSHEYIFLLTKKPKYYFDADAISEGAIYTGLKKQDESGFKRASDFDGKHAKNPEVRREARARAVPPRHAEYASSDQSGLDDVGRGGKRNKRSVWTVATRPFMEAHFATFPPELIEPCIMAGCPPSGVVLDPFGGAGTTGLVADRLQRHAILIELNPKYVDMARRRLHADGGIFMETK